ncbi:MAG TPA: PAS domain-containing sensor histidine kinase [Candidatus Limnocylindria bacterium]|nr:PAS domain-containing sensor histidine kinase [Candidatus Limnocylindria bacterium]
MLVGDEEEAQRPLEEEPPAKLRPTRDEHAFRLLVEAVRDYAIFLLDPEGRVQTWNAGAERIKQYTADEIIGQHLSVFYTDEELAEGLPQRLLNEARRNGSARYEGWRVRRDRSRFWADVTITALFDDDGSLYGFAKVTRDLTERRENEQRERQLLVEREARRGAEEAVRIRDRFLSIAAHELRTPIHTLHLSADLLLKRRAADALGPDELAIGLARIAKATGRLSTLVNELLDVSKLTAGELGLTRGDVDLGDLASGIVELYRGTHQGRRLDFFAEPGVIVSADAARVEQVVSNLIDNALKYSQAPEPVTLEVSRERGGGVLKISDRGIGMDVEAIAAMQKPFTRGANAAHIEGLGLGLYITHEIIARHGGTIAFGSQGDGVGTTVRVWLPSVAAGSGISPAG